MPYNYRSLQEIDYATRDYLKFVMPYPLETVSIEDINTFLTTMEQNFIELDNTPNLDYVVCD